VDRFGSGGTQGGKRAESPGEQHCDVLPHVTDPEPEEQGGQRLRFRLGDGPDERAGGLRREPLERLQAFRGELVDVGDVADQLHR
jgi:hypothetical protein